MAEVGQTLRTGVYRLSSLRSSRGRAACTGERPGYVLVNCSVSDSCEIQNENKTTQRKTEKVSPVRKSKRQQENVSLLCVSPLLQERLLLVRMASWTRGVVSINPDTFGSPQQLRALWTVLFTLADQRSEPGLSTLIRKYCWSSGRGFNARPPLYRSKMAYYDILNVSPSATQSQIKTAYYKQSLIHHPDKNLGNKEATTRFSEISEAYTILGNISLRKKYDRGILSQSDVQGAGRPTSKETTSTSAGSPHHHQQQQHQQRGRQFYQPGGRPTYDFDAFYRAHYGEQLQKEKEMRARRAHMQETQRQQRIKWRHWNVMELSVALLLTMAGLILLDITKN